MKYFFDANGQAEIDRNELIEFKAHGQSIYMRKSVIRDSGFYDFWLKCMQDDIVFDMDTISKNELLMMCSVWDRSTETVTEILSELHVWAEPLLNNEGSHIEVVRGYERDEDKEAP